MTEHLITAGTDDRDDAGPEKDLPLRNDIRLLGRILGDTVRELEGERVFDIVEAIRQASVRFHRSDDAQADVELEGILSRLTQKQAVAIIRAFSYFSHLANIAEDQHHIRRTRAHALAASPPKAGALAHTLAHAKAQGLSARELRAFFGGALISPVITAHPTEVRRSSTIGRELAIARLLDELDRLELTREEVAEREAELRRAVVALWQTPLLRRTKLSVRDEIANGLSSWDHAFLRELPRLYGRIEAWLAAEDAESGDANLPAFFRVGSWIGGDRDGNPFVTAESLREAFSLQSGKAIGFYLGQLRRLSEELPVSDFMVDVSDELRVLSARSRNRDPHRRNEPYRLAISWIADRLAATAEALNGADPNVAPDVTPDAGAQDFLDDLDIMSRSLIANRARILAQGRLQNLRCAVSCFGFHLATVDLRQNSRVHERSVAEMFEAVAPGTGYGELPETDRVALLTRELETRRPLTSPFFEWSDETASELDILRTAAELRTVYGAHAIENCIVSISGVALRRPRSGCRPAAHHLRPHPTGVAGFCRRIAGGHGAGPAPCQQSPARPLDPQPLPLSRPAEPSSGRASAQAPLGGIGRADLRGIQLTINGISAGLRNSG